MSLTSTCAAPKSTYSTWLPVCKAEHVKQLIEDLGIEDYLMLKAKPKVKEKLKHLPVKYKNIFIFEGRTMGRVPEKYVT